MRRGRCLQIIPLLLLAGVALFAVTEEVTDRDVARALNIANAGDAQRASFHAPYIMNVADAAIEQLEVITEFRRFVLAAEEETKKGNWMLSRGGYDPKGRSLKDILRPTAGQVSIRVRLRFHPLNVYVTVPPIDVLLGEPTLLAVSTSRTPHVTPAGEPGTRDIITGATVETFFNAPTIADRALPARIVIDARETARTMIDFSRLE